MIGSKSVRISLSVLLLALLAAVNPWAAGADETDTLLTQAKQVFGPLPSTIPSNATRSLPRRSRWEKYFSMRREFPWMGR